MHSIKGKPTYVWLFLIGLIAVIAKVNAADDPFQCLRCTSKEAACLNSTLEMKPCEKGVTKCFTSSENGVITRDCYDGKTPCTSESNCMTCDSKNGCNNQNICKTCKTSDDDCSQTNVSDDKFNEICKDADTQCFVNVNDKKVERRCANNDDKCADNTDKSCKLCKDANCNAGIFPESRRQCFECSGSGCDAAGTDKNKSKPCANYVPDDKCYAKGTKADDMTRGCLSDTKPTACESSDKTCLICDADDCNSATYERDPKLKCIKCSGSECSKEYTSDKAEACEKKLLYYQTESCYTQTKGSTVKRGCLIDDINDVCDAEGACNLCTTEGCNNAKKDVTFTCIVCRSDENKLCWNDAKNVTGKSCRTSVSSPEEGCFHGIWNGIAIRGCYVDASPPMQVTCTDTKNPQCLVCHEGDCNTGNSSGAGSIRMSFGVLAIVFAVLWNFL